MAERQWRQTVDRRLGETLDALADHEARFNRGNTRFEKTDDRIATVEHKVDLNNAMTARIETNTAEILAIFAAFQGFQKVSGWAGKLILWIAGILLAIGVIWWAFKTGEFPKKP